MTKTRLRLYCLMMFLSMTLSAQPVRENDLVALKNWAAPLYWQPTHAEARFVKGAATDVAAVNTTSPAGGSALVFVAMTPCRMVDTRAGSGFSGAFGPPSLGTGATRTFPVQSSGCSVPSLAKAYSLNVTVVPPGPLGFITVFATGSARPNASTLNDSTGLIIANAAIVPAGTGGSVDVFANNATDVILDINGYYAPPTDLSSNTGLGYNTLVNNTGVDNTAIGSNALASNTTGSHNTATGDQALLSNTTGSDNTAYGINALSDNINGNSNTASGYFAMIHNTAGSENTASGYQALANNTGGDRNTASGFQALLNDDGGALNTAIGHSALLHTTTGTNNVAVGYAAGYLATGNNNILIANPGVAGENGATRIGTTNQDHTYISGIVGAFINTPNTTVFIDGDGRLGTTSSSRRYKEDIADMGDASSALMRLRPVTFRYKTAAAVDGSKPLEYGLIAEEVNEVYPGLVFRKDGRIESVQYQYLAPMLLNELQKQYHHAQQQDENFRRQRDEIREQREQLKSLEAEVAALQKTIETLMSNQPRCCLTNDFPAGLQIFGFEFWYL